jgi:uncharacterized protein YhbP (UPF0306 family)
MDVEKIVREYIDKTVHMSLATVRDNKPWVSEVHFAYDEELNLYWRSLRTRRHSQEISDNPHVAGNIIDKYAVGEPVVGIYFEGKAERLSPGADQDKAAKLLQTRIQAAPDIVEEAAREDGHQFYKISVENWYAFGRFGGESGQKFQLSWH